MDSNFLYKAVMILVPMILSLTVHEYSHALAAKLLGDDTAEKQGRLTLSPLPHIDIFGTILLPLLSIGTGIPFLGWAKPVPTNPVKYTRKVTERTGYMLVSIAGPLSNFLFAFLAMIILKISLAIMGANLSIQLYQILAMFIIMNFGLAFFNLLPIPPLDGSKILQWLLPDKYADFMEKNGQYFFFLLVILVFTNTIDYIVAPIFSVIRFFISIFGLPPII
jgi:Zn-dependent protease